MSCGQPHETPCTEVLARVYTYLDGELDQGGCEKVREHLDECGPCLRQYDLEEVVKKLVNKSCGCEPVPDELRAKVMGRIQELCTEAGGSVEITETEVGVQGPGGIAEVRRTEIRLTEG